MYIYNFIYIIHCFPQRLVPWHFPPFNFKFYAEKQFYNTVYRIQTHTFQYELIYLLLHPPFVSVNRCCILSTSDVSYSRECKFFNMHSVD